MFLLVDEALLVFYFFAETQVCHVFNIELLAHAGELTGGFTDLALSPMYLIEDVHLLIFNVVVLLLDMLKLSNEFVNLMSVDCNPSLVILLKALFLNLHLFALVN